MTRTIQTDLDEKYLELRQRRYLKDLAAQERRCAMIAESEAARVARGEPNLGRIGMLIKPVRLI
jgi:hypothetical protein